VGYDDDMSESQNESGTSQPSSEQGLISDEQLPDDLRPDKNPMARDPDDSDEAGSTGPADASSDGGPDMGQPG